MIGIKEKFKKIPWFMWGIFGYILGLLYSIYTGFDFSTLKNIIDIFKDTMLFISAGSIYFFLFSTVSYWIKKKSLENNAWAILTLGFYISSVFLAFREMDGDIIASISFIVLYGIFFVEFIIGFIEPFFDIKNLDFLQFFITSTYNLIFFSWMFLEFSSKKFKNINKIRIIKLILLLLLFIMLSMGMISCLSNIY